MNMITCKNCGEEIDKNKKFCNSSCAATFNNMGRKLSQDTKNKISNSAKANFNNLSEEDKQKLKIKKQEANRSEKKIKKTTSTWIKKLFDVPFEELSWDNMRKRIHIEQNNCCKRCNINEWLGEKIILEIDHKDGDRNNNNRDNLIGLCPNCHSLTPTWRGKKNKNSGKKNISDELLKETVLKHKKIIDAFRELGIAESGKNYKRVMKLLKGEIDLENNKGSLAQLAEQPAFNR